MSGQQQGPRSEVHGSAIVVGASLAGLMSALTLARIGMQVTMLERSGRKRRSGAALPVSDGLLERLTGRRARGRTSALPAGGQAWADVHAGLSRAVRDEPAICLRSAVRVTEVGQDDRSAWVVTENGEQVRADLLVGADGHASLVRRHAVPEAPAATFSGYVIWLGMIDESQIRSGPWPSDLAILYERGYCLNAYYLPGPDGSRVSGRRRVGWGWYDAGRNDLMRASGAVVGDAVHRTLRPDDVPAATFDELAREAEAIWPDPWREAILDCIAARAVIGTPIGEYLPSRLHTGRVCLVGDAAHLPSPMTGSGFSASAQDALALADALVHTRGSARGIAAGLARYEGMRLDAARRLVRSGQSFSRSFAPRGAAQ